MTKPSTIALLHTAEYVVACAVAHPEINGLCDPAKECARMLGGVIAEFTQLKLEVRDGTGNKADHDARLAWDDKAARTAAQALENAAKQLDAVYKLNGPKPVGDMPGATTLEGLTRITKEAAQAEVKETGPRDPGSDFRRNLHGLPNRWQGGLAEKAGRLR
jgi:hypothetical protein